MAHIACPAHTRLDLVGDEQDPELVAQLAEIGHPARSRDDDAAFALDGLDEDRSDLGRLDLMTKQRVAQVIDGRGVAFTSRRATRVGVWRVQDRPGSGPNPL
jgi:hypothetical protein